MDYVWLSNSHPTFLVYIVCVAFYGDYKGSLLCDILLILSSSKQDMFGFPFKSVHNKQTH